MTAEEARALDAQIAELVMGLEIHSHSWPVRNYSDAIWVMPENEPKPEEWSRQRDVVWKFRDVNIRGEEYSSLCRVADYSTEMDAAWEVAERLRNHGFQVRVESVLGRRQWTCTVWRPNRQEVVSEPCSEAPEAICRAALEWAALAVVGRGREG